MSFCKCSGLLSLSVYAILCSGICRSLAEDSVTVKSFTPCATAHYSFGTAVDSSGRVLFTEFSHRQIRSWDPRTGNVEVWRDKDTPGMFGLATGTGGDVFVGLDLGDAGNPGKVMRSGSDRQEEFVMENITRPRQLTCDPAGNLFVVLEGGKVFKWDKTNRNVTEIMTATPPVSGIAVASDGSVYVSEYGVFDVAPEGYSHPLAPGQVKVRKPDGVVSILAKGFWRARGLALHENSLFLCTESNREDHGNAGQLVRIDTQKGTSEILLETLDYPQFPAASPNGKVYFTLGRDNALVSYDSAAPFRKAEALADHVKGSSVRGGSIISKGTPEGIPFSIRAQSVLLAGSFIPDPGAKSMDGWIEVPADQFQLNPNEHSARDAEHPGPGIFELPQVESACDSGRLQIDVFPLRRHQGCRWPMQNVGTANESPAPGFSEQPAAFRFHFSWTAMVPKQK